MRKFWGKASPGTFLLFFVFCLFLSLQFHASIARAASISNPFEDCDDPGVFDNGGAGRRCADKYATHLGITSGCPEQNTSHGVCEDGPWMNDCIFRCVSMEGDNGVTAEDCGAYYGDWDFSFTLRCVVSETFIQKEWPGIRDTYKGLCKNCVESCYFYSITKGVDIGSCIQDGIPGQMEACRAYPPDHPKRVCATQGWVDEYNSNPVGFTAQRKKLCEIGCSSPAIKNKNECLAGCEKKLSIIEVADFLKSLGVTSDTIGRDSQKKVEDILTKFFYQNIPEVSFGQIPGGFGCTPDPGDPKKCVGGVVDVNGFMKDVWSVASILFGGLAILKIVFGGVMYATAAGNAQRTSSAKEHILYAIIGLVVIILANIILNILGAGENLLKF